VRVLNLLKRPFLAESTT